MNRILLLLEHKKNRRLLAEWLGSHYEVLQPELGRAFDQPFDLGIVDGIALDRAWEQVQARKQAEQPVFLPFLLVTSRQDVGMVTRHLWQTVDELIISPIEKVELQARVESLLQARQLSLELKRSDLEALAASEAKFRALVEESLVGVYVIQNGRFAYVNPRLAEIFGYTQEEVLSQLTVADLVAESDRAMVAEKIRQRLSGEIRSAHYTLRGRRKDGQLIEVEVLGVRTEWNNQPAVLGTLLDITERKRVEEEIRRRNQELATLYHASQVFAQSLEPEVIGQRLIEVMERLVGYEYGAVVLVDEATQEVLPLALSDQGRGLEFVVQEKEYVRSKRLRVGQGIVGWVMQHGQPVRVGDVRQDPRYFGMREGIRSELCVPLVLGEKVIGAINVETSKPDAYDEDDERLLTALAGTAAVAIENARLYKQVQQHAAELEQRVAQRTAELKVALEKAREADRLKSEFLATMSHELRTPLNSIIGFTGIILQGIAGEINDEQRKQLTMVYGSAKHLLSLINDLLDLSRIESGKMEVLMQRFHIQDVVSEVVHSLAPMVSQKGLSLITELPQEPVEIISDRKKVYQILLNLANNAVKFTERGEVRITCQVGPDTLTVSVSDTGIGIKPENMALLFEAFRQVDSSARRRYEGAGLGLHLCKRLITLLGGTIWAESEYGKGSRFTFTLPLEGSHQPKGGSTSTD